MGFGWQPVALNAIGAAANMPLTITEALAEIKTIDKRVQKKRASINQYLARPDAARDPLEKDGGSVAFITNERQAIRDLEDRIVTLRRSIRNANETTRVTIGTTTRTIADWLIWRREVAPMQQKFLGELRSTMAGLRQQCQRQGQAIVAAGNPTSGPTDVIININERELAEDIEAIEAILGALDGQLSLKNATILVED